MRAFAPVSVAIVVCLATPAFASGQSHVSAARKAEKRGDWRKALKEWKAAYKAEVNAEYLIGIGDAYAHLGNKAQAKKSYEAYLSDPLALPANVSKVKAKIVQLEASPRETLALPGPGLTLPGAEAAAAPSPGAPTRTAKSEPMLPLPGLDPSQSAANDKLLPPPLPLPGVAAAAAKKEAEKVASAAPVPPLPLPGVAAKADTGKKEAAPAVATKEPPKPAKPIAMATPAPERTAVPVAAVAATPLPREMQARSSSGVQRTMAFVTAGVAIAALGGGAYAFTQANSAHNDLTGKVHSGAEAQRLLETERQNKTLSFVGLAGGLVAAGIATALFAF
jgi:hypothetical protein